MGSVAPPPNPLVGIAVLGCLRSAKDAQPCTKMSEDVQRCKEGDPSQRLRDEVRMMGGVREMVKEAHEGTRRLARMVRAGQRGLLRLASVDWPPLGSLPWDQQRCCKMHGTHNSAAGGGHKPAWRGCPEDDHGLARDGQEMDKRWSKR